MPNVNALHPLEGVELNLVESPLLCQDQPSPSFLTVGAFLNSFYASRLINQTNYISRLEKGKTALRTGLYVKRFVRGNCPLPNYGPLGSANRPVRTSTRGGVRAGGLPLGYPIRRFVHFLGAPLSHNY